MKIKTVPASRFGWPGVVVEYRVRADEAAELVLPESPPGLEAHVKESHQTSGGIEAQLEVRVRPDAKMD